MTEPWQHVDSVNGTAVRATTYPYGGGVDDHGIQIALGNGPTGLAARLPHIVAVALAGWVLRTYGLPIVATAEQEPPTVDGKALLTPGELAVMFRVDPKTVTRWAKAGTIRSFRTPGGHRRFRAADVQALIEAGGG